MKKGLKMLLVALCAVLVVTAAGFFLYTSDYYRTDAAAIAAMAGTTVRLENNLTILSPDEPSGTGLIFYPGGKVEHTAYLPLLERLRQAGVTCVLVEMPFHLAVFAPNAADQVFDALPEIKSWYIGGHSLGGAMASGYAADHQDRIEGLVLLGAYVYGDFPPERALTVYGSEDQVLDRGKVAEAENAVVIQGGNHAQFGNYGPQKGDGAASISPDEQQAQTVAAILAFIRGEGDA